MNTFIPFICLGFGALISWRGLPIKILKLFNSVMNISLFALMTIIGMNIGLSDTVIASLGGIGFNCIVISLISILVSCFLVVLCEKTVMPLEEIRIKLLAERTEKEEVMDRNKKTISDGKSVLSPLVFLMPGFIVLGIILGITVFSEEGCHWLSTALTVCLVFLYTGVGVSLAQSKEVFSYIKKLGVRVFIMPLAIFAGCLVGGFLSGLVLGVDNSISVLSSSGMGYYSLTGAFMTESMGIDAGVYGFVVNVVRDVFTVLLMPFLIRISKGSPIASGAAGCMDTMLVPVTKAVGPELGLVALISGTVLTFFVPIWLPIGLKLFG